MSDAKQRQAEMTAVREREQADRKQFVTSLREGKVSIKLQIEGGSSSVILRENEELRMVLPNMALLEARRITTTTGGYGGPSVRVAKGVYLRGGAFGSESQSHDKLKEIDKGRLTLTNKRLIFTGAKRTSEIGLAKIISIETYSDGIAVEASGRSKTQCFVGLGPNRIPTNFTINERSYSEPFTGLTLKYMIEGLVKQQEEASKQSSRKPQSRRVAKEPDIPEQIRKLGELKDAGVITVEEFEKKKAELLARM